MAACSFYQTVSTCGKGWFYRPLGCARPQAYPRRSRARREGWRGAPVLPAEAIRRGRKWVPMRHIEDWKAGLPGARADRTPGPRRVPRRFPVREHSPANHRPLAASRSEEHTSELQSPCNLVCRLLLEKKKTADQYKTLQVKQYE